MMLREKFKTVLFQNLFSLYGIYALNYILPLILIPFLARVLGVEIWGTLALAEGYGNYVSLIVEFGFSLSATRDLAQIRQDALERSRCVGRVLGAQCFLSMGVIAATVLVTSSVPNFSAHSKLLWLAVGLGIARSINPLWYFQALERMRVPAVANVGANLLALAGTLIFVRSAPDAWLSIAFRALAAVATTIVSLFLLFRDTRWITPTVREACSALGAGSSIFFFRSAVSLYTTANVLILGAYASPAEVAWYAGAERIIRGTLSATHPVMQAFYPRIVYLLAASRVSAVRELRRSALLTIGIAAASTLFLFCGAGFLVNILLGPRFGQSIALLRILSVLPFLIAPANVLGLQWMLPLRMDRDFNGVIVGAGLLNLSMSFLLARKYHDYGMAWGVVIAEIFVTSSLIAVLMIRRRAPWNPPYASTPAEEVIPLSV